MQNNYKSAVVPVAMLLLTIPFFPVSAASPLDQSIRLGMENNREERHSQDKIDHLDDKTRSMLEEYHTLSRELEALQIYNKQLERLVLSQQEEENSLLQQMEEIELTQQEIVPLILRMVSWLEQLVAEDSPFLLGERQQRVRLLHELMDRANVTVAEKYRRVIEAYQIEMDYSRSIEAYRDDVEVEGSVRTVDMLRVGRIGLYYVSLDGKYGGYWHKAEKKWLALPGGEIHSIRQGLRIARKQGAPQLLRIRLPAPERDMP